MVASQLFNLFAAEPPPSRHRRAITLVELLVAISIIGVLIGLLLPAIQAAREAARGMQCKANLRQLGLALHAYNADHNQFPAGRIFDSRGVARGDFSAFTSLLPYVEQRGLFDAINFDFGPFESAESPILANRTARRTTVALFLCPSDGEPNRRANYRFNRGRFGVGGVMFDGPFGLASGATHATLRDGLSQTAFVSERVAGNFLPGSTDRKRNVMYPAGSMGEVIESDPQYIPLCLAAQPIGWEATSGRYWIYAGHANTHYNHNGTPNDPRPSCGTGNLRDWPPIGLHPPRSFHPYSVNVLFGDGHAETMSNTIDRQVWTKIGTHAAGD